MDDLMQYTTTTYDDLIDAQDEAIARLIEQLANQGAPTHARADVA